MNILYISNDISLYGANRSLLDMLRPMIQKKHQVYVLSWSHNVFTDELERQKIPYLVVPYKPCAFPESDMPEKYYEYVLYNLYLSFRIRSYIKKNKIQLIHTNASNVDFGALLSRVCHLPHVWHVREALYEDYKLKYADAAVEKKLLRRAEKVVFISDYVRELRKMNDVNGITVYDGLNIKMYYDERELFEESDMKILIACTMREEKGVMDAVRAVDILVNQKKKKNVRLVMAGAYSPFVDVLKETARQCKITQNVEYVGNVSNLRELRRWADISLTCSRSEAMGRVTIEAMLAGMLVIGAKAGATKELIKDGGTGILYEACNPAELAEKIIGVYENKEKMREIAAKGQQFAVQQFDGERYADKILQVYEELL